MSTAFATGVFGEEPFAGYPYVGDPSTPTFPLLLLEEAFTSAPLAESPEFVDLGQDDLDSFSITHNNRSSELDSPSAGSGAFVVDDTAGRALDATNPSSPYAPNVKSNRRVRLRILHDGVTWPMWEGFADGHNMRYEIASRFQAFCDLAATDGFKMLQRAPLTGMAPRPKERAHVRVAAILDHVGWPESRRAISAARTILSPEDISGGKALDALRAIDLTECGRLRIDQAGNLVFLSRVDVQSAERQTVSQATFSDSEAEGTIPYLSAVIDNSETMIRNIVRVTHPTDGEVVVEEAASIDEHGPLDYQRELRDVTEVARKATAEHFLTAYKDERTRVLSVTVLTSDTPPGYPTGMYGKMASLQVGDRVTFERTVAPGGDDGVSEEVGETLGTADPFVQECFIESKTDSAVRGEHKWTTTLGFSFAPPVVLGSKYGSGKYGTAKWGW